VVIVAVQPLGILRGTMLLVIALPLIERSLNALGWADILARGIAAKDPGQRRLVALYGTWLGISALLTLGAAAIVATPGSPLLGAGGPRHGSRRDSWRWPWLAESFE
jgi:hypothetical protein